MKQRAEAVAQREEALREANRIHCRQTRERKRDQERLLREEVELLQLCRSIVESGPDLFSVHGMNPSAPFCFVGQSFCQKLQIEPEEILGQPLWSIVDPRDAAALQNVVLHVLGGGREGGGASGAGAGGGGSSASWSSVASTALDPFFDTTAAGTRGSSANSRGGGGGCLVNVLLTRFSLSCYAGMSIAVGSQGLIVVTRLYLS